MSDILLTLAATMPLWQGPVIVLLAGVVVGCFHLVAEAM